MTKTMTVNRRKRKTAREVGVKKAPTIKRHFSLAPETFQALEELKQGLKKALPHTGNMHTYTFAMEQAVHYTLNAIEKGTLSYTDLFQVPRTDVTVSVAAEEEVPQ